MTELNQDGIKYQGRITEVTEEGRNFQFAVLFPDIDQVLRFEKSIDKIVVALKGGGDFMVGGDKVSLQKGDVLIILANNEHFIVDNFHTDRFRFNLYPHLH